MFYAAPFLLAYLGPCCPQDAAVSPMAGDLHLVSVACQAVGDGLSQADIHGGLARAVSVLGPDDIDTPLGQRVAVELDEEEVAPVAIVTACPGTWAVRAVTAPLAAPGLAGVAAGARQARTRRQAVTPLPSSTPSPSGNALARACRAAWRSCS